MLHRTLTTALWLLLIAIITAAVIVVRSYHKFSHYSYR
jgi:hypothetical protein